MASKDVLIADDEPNIRFLLSELMRREGYRPVEAANGVEAVEFAQESRFDIAILDIRMPKLDGMQALEKLLEINPDLIAVMITAHGTQETALQALEAGAYDFFSKPFDINEVRVVVRRAMEKIQLLQLVRDMREERLAQYAFDNIIGQSKPMQEVFQLLGRVTGNDVTVLVTGESGTGKELIAAALHHNGPRAEKPFVKVNTAAIPETLLESELFGHEKGAFTGAVSQKIGKVEAANGGTLFLDEIGDMSLPLQAKLLRVLQEREIERVGSTKTLPVDIRVVCATNRDLQKMVDDGSFREDLYYRINVLPIYLPPLRKRREDIPLLIEHFIQYYNPRLGKHVSGFSQGALAKFVDYPWPGNVRELENMVQRTMLLAQGQTITVEDIPAVLQTAALRTPIPTAGRGGVEGLAEDHPLRELDLSVLLDDEDFSTPLAEKLALLTDHVEKYLIKVALAKTGGHRQESADLLGISRKFLHNKMVRYGMFADE